MEYPKTPKRGVVDSVHGRKLVDDYRWLENVEDPEVKDWVEAQNEVVDDYISKIGSKQKFYDELEDITKITVKTNPVPKYGRYFWEERKPDEDQFALYWSRGLKGNPRLIFNPNGLEKDNAVSLDYWASSPKGKYVCYGVSEGGTEISVMRIQEIDTGKELESIPYTRYASVAWLRDESGFYYTRLPTPGTVPKGEEQYHNKVYFHRLGTDYLEDPMIFGAGRPKDDMIGIQISEDSRYLLIRAGQDWTKNDVFRYDAVTKKLVPWIVGVDAQFSIHQAGGRHYCLTNYKANNYRIIARDIEGPARPVSQWNELIPEAADVLEGFRITADKLVVAYTVNACSKVVLFDRDGAEIRDLNLPPLSVLAGFTTHREEKEFFYGVGDFLSTKTIYRYNPDKEISEKFWGPEIQLDRSKFQVSQLWYKSSDGKEIPMFVMHQAGMKLDGGNKAILYGYGGFAHMQQPGFLTNWIPLIKRGYVFSIACIRGGGEFGEEWHKGGIKANKQQSFDDFVAAAEFLVREGYTKSSKLAIAGGSNGGLLVGAVMTQRPELFGAVICRVPLLDMVRFPLYLIASRWVHEYGDPSIKKEFEWIIKWSPFHNVKKGINYPSVMFTTAENDGRVHAMHAWKMAALMQSYEPKNPVIVRTETRAGHGAGKPKSKIIETQAEILSFITEQLQ